MKTLKSISFFALIFVFGILASSSVNAEFLEISDVSAPSSVDEDAGSFIVSFNINYTGSQDNITIDFSDSNTNFGSINIPTIILNKNESSIISATINLPSDKGGETLSGTINATGSGSESENSSTATEGFSVDISDISEPDESEPLGIQDCSLIGNLGGNLRITIDDVRVTDGFGDDDYYWYPFDTVIVDAEVRNRGREYIDNIELRWGVYDEREEKWIVDDRESDFDLYDGEERTVSFEFQLDDPRDFRDTDNVRLYVWATGEDEEFDFNETCDSTSTEVDIINDDEFVLLDNIKLSNDKPYCEDLVEITADVWNIGDRRQRDVKVRASIEEIGFYEEIELGEIRESDYKRLRMDLNIPEDIEEKEYTLLLEVYDRDNDIYETEERDFGSSFYVPIEVIGNCETSDEDDEEMPNAVVSASLVSGGKAGEELVISSDIFNTGDKEIFEISTEGHENWGSLTSISPEILNLEKGESEEVVFRFDVNEDASGEKTFNIVVTGENQNSISQPVQVPIEESDKGFFSDILNENLIITILIVLIVIVVILIIIVLIIRILKK
ncbi:MAG: putative S-layer protein [Nanoarchaeota archaeon]